MIAKLIFLLVQTLSKFEAKKLYIHNTDEIHLLKSLTFDIKYKITFPFSQLRLVLLKYTRDTFHKAISVQIIESFLF